ncbi:TonB-dependent receptor [Mitsuaria sp. WAJ17]|uniref:TonB-dependent receptor domain-containing protein n=1 Tax=Mitsuaria sp. WAJ17 TaxID=2761452 RepID=UPI001602CB9A|nr:TonB-dependent receptor [Mitsuaria sp. WAJ17]MBB2485057.1 TonB-dependent receptor [Mitsuaria sp. WAJ17]
MSASFLRAARQPSPARLPASVRPSSTLSVIALSLLALSAQAQETPNKLGQVQVTATRSKLELSQALADVTVLTRADIERQGFGNLVDLLGRQSCVELVRNGNPGTNTSLFLRGANTQHTLLLVDGVRMDTQSGSGGAAWEAIPLAQIERVEIVRGAASSVYGSDAMSGVIQVFTRKGKRTPTVEIGAGVGSLGLVKGDLSLSGAAGALDYALSLAQEVADGFNIRKVSNDPGYNPDIDGWRTHSVNARLGYQLDAGQRLELVNTYSSLDSDYDASAKPKVGVRDRNVHDTHASRALWSAQWTNDWQTEASLGDSRERYETLTNNASTYLTETQVRQYALGSTIKLPVGQLNAVLERREDKLVNSGLMPATGGQVQRHQNAVGASYLYSNSSIDAQLHLRHDQDSAFGGVNTGTVAAGWRFLPGLRAWASAGTAFRAPTLYQSYSEFGPKPGVAALNPERGRNTELGLNWSQGDSELGLTVYNNRIRDLISWDGSFAAHCVSTYGGCYGNLAKVRLQGVTLQGETQIAGLRMQGSLDFQNPRDLGTDKLLGRRAKKHGSLRLEKTLNQWSGGLQIQAHGSRFDDNANTKPLGGYALVHLDLSYRVNPQVRLQANIDNAFNKDYETAKGYSQAPRTFFVGVRFTPGV